MAKLKWILVLFCGLIYFQSQANSFDEALKAYKSKNWSEAQNLFEKHISEKPEDANAFYNLGVCLMKQDKLVDAIWYFEKCYKLNPGHPEAQIQLNSCYKKLNFIDSWSAPIGLIQAKMYKIPFSTWTLILVIFSTFSGVLIFLLTSKKGNRKVIFPFLILGVGILAFTSYTVFKKNQFQTQANTAIVLQAIESVWISEKGNALLDLKLNAGERVTILDTNERVEIILPSREHIWIDKTKLKVIQ